MSPQNVRKLIYLTVAFRAKSCFYSLQDTAIRALHLTVALWMCHRGEYLLNVELRKPFLEACISELGSIVADYDHG